MRDIGYRRNDITLLGHNSADMKDDLEVRFNGTKVSRITSTDMIFGSAGGMRIKGEDIDDNDPLRVEVKSGEILKVTTFKVSSEDTKIAITLNSDKKSANIWFAFLNRKQGIYFNVLHTAEPDDLIVCGTVRELRFGIRYIGVLQVPHSALPKNKPGPPIYTWFMTGVGFVLFMLGLFSVNNTVRKILGTAKNWQYMLFLGAFLFLLGGIFLLLILKRDRKARIDEDA